MSTKIRYYGFEPASMYIKEWCLEPAAAGAGAAPAPAPAPPADTGSCVVDGAHAFVLRISSVFGLAPLRFERLSSGCAVSLSSAMCVYSYILVTLLVACTVWGLAAEVAAGPARSPRMATRVAQAVSAADVLVVAATAVAGVYGAPARMRAMLRFLHTVASVDASLGAQYSARGERRLRAALAAVLALFAALLLDDFCFYAHQASRLDRTWEVAANYAAFYLLWLVVVLLELQFAFTALSVRGRFRALNHALAHTARRLAVPEKMSESQQLNMFAIRVAPAERRQPPPAAAGLLPDPLAAHDHTVLTRDPGGSPRLAVPPCEAVRRLAALHGALCGVLQRVDASYGLPLVVILISTLLHLIVTPYFLIMEIIVSTNRVHFLVLQFLWCAMHVLRMFVVVEPCHYTVSEGKRTEDLVCRLMTYAPSTGVLPARLDLFSRQLLLRSVHYTPLGMCTLDRPLVASVIGAVTTYLVILIQFQRYDA